MVGHALRHQEGCQVVTSLLIAVTCLGMIMVTGFWWITKELRWLRAVLPTWMFHISALLRGEDPPGDAPVPPMPPVP
jgi:hypothetical protein